MMDATQQKEYQKVILETQKYAKEDTSKSWRLTIEILALIVLSYVALGLIKSVPLQVFISFILSFFLIRMFIIYHDFVHRAILIDNKTAKWIMRVYGIFILNPMNAWKRSHNFHHKHNSKISLAAIGSYPIMTTDEYKEASSKERFIYLFTRHPLTIIFGYFSVFQFGMCLHPFIQNWKQNWDGMLALIIHYAAYGVLFYFGMYYEALVFLFIPFFVSFMVGSYLFYAQHNFPSVKLYDKPDWNYLEAALTSSSYMKAPKIVHWFLGNIGYHHIHHLNPCIPFYNLPKVMNDIPALQKVSTTNLSPMEIIRCFSLKVWDEQLGKMTGLPK